MLLFSCLVVVCVVVWLCFIMLICDFVSRKVCVMLVFICLLLSMFICVGVVVLVLVIVVFVFLGS